MTLAQCLSHSVSRMEPVWCVHWLSTIIIVQIMVSSTRGACLDGADPAANDALMFCTQYSSLGCCSLQDDRTVSGVYRELHDMSRMDGDRQQHELTSTLNDVTSQDAGVSAQCVAMMRHVLCSRCHPDAALLHTAPPVPTCTVLNTTLPLMCPYYCHHFHEACRSLLAVNQCPQGRDRHVFCDAYSSKDDRKCFPRIMTTSSTATTTTTTLAPAPRPRHPGTSDIFYSAQPPDPLDDQCLCMKDFSGGYLSNVVGMIHAPDDNMYVVDQRGFIFTIDSNGHRTSETPFLNLSSRINGNYTLAGPDGQRNGHHGLMGLVFHPNFTSNGRFFIHYTSMTVSTPVKYDLKTSEFTADVEKVLRGEPQQVNVSTERKILWYYRAPRPREHNGGQMLFGIDGYLYIFMGDGAAQTDPENNPRKLTTLFGKVLRIDVDTATGDTPYTVPGDNPFVGRDDARPEVWASGFRNPWRCSQDRGHPQTGEGRGRIFCGDVGHHTSEEIDIVKKGANYGWPSREGPVCHQQDDCEGSATEELPLVAYGGDFGRAVIGGYVYRGADYPHLQGVLVFGDLLNNQVWGLRQTQSHWTLHDLNVCQKSSCGFGPFRFLMSFAEDRHGALYMLLGRMRPAGPRGWAGVNNGRIFRVTLQNKTLS